MPLLKAPAREIRKGGQSYINRSQSSEKAPNQVSKVCEKIVFLFPRVIHSVGRGISFRAKAGLCFYVTIRNPSFHAWLSHIENELKNSISSLECITQNIFIPFPSMRGSSMEPYVQLMAHPYLLCKQLFKPLQAGLEFYYFGYESNRSVHSGMPQREES